MLVHSGEALDALVLPSLLLHGNNNTTGNDGGGAHSSAMTVSSFVVVSFGVSAAAGSDRIACTTTANSPPHAGDGDRDEAMATEVLYEHRYSPFAATRVIESCNAPAWNELLTLSLPFEWREPDTSGGLRRQQQEQERRGVFALKVELVQRGPSQQEDFLLATALVPLQSLACHRHYAHLALQFAPALPRAQRAAATTTRAQVFVSLRETTRDVFASSSPSARAFGRVEVLADRFIPAATTATVNADASSTQQQPLSLRRELVCALALTVPLSDHAIEHERLSGLFAAVRDGSTLDAVQECACVGVTPSAPPDMLGARSSPPETGATATERFRWLYPLVFEVPPTLDSDNEGANVIQVALYDTCDVQRSSRVGDGEFPALREICRSTSDSQGDGERHTLAPPVPIYAVSGSGSATTRTLVGHLHATVRWWSPDAWAAFVREAPTRRVVSSNRNLRKTSAVLALGWMGALVRGLNRYPVSSFCDEGGLSSVLAGLLSASSSPSPNLSTSTHQGASERNAVLVAQVAHLQAESTTQRQEIERVRTSRHVTSIPGL